MRRIDALHLQWPFYGSRKLCHALRAEGIVINRKRTRRLMRLMGLESVAPKPTTSAPHPEHPRFPYLLRNLLIFRPNQVWAADITYIPMAHGFAYLVAIIDWYSRLGRFPKPEIFNTDQGSQFTAEAFTRVLRGASVTISMDGRGRCIDNVFVERVWRSLKYEEVFLHAYDDLDEGRAGIGRYFDFYNLVRPHQALGYRTPDALHRGALHSAA
jgi:putative transposase